MPNNVFWFETFPDFLGRHATHNRIGCYVSCHNRARGNDRASTNIDTPDESDTSSYPYVITDLTSQRFRAAGEDNSAPRAVECVIVTRDNKIWSDHHILPDAHSNRNLSSRPYITVRPHYQRGMNTATRCKVRRRMHGRCPVSCSQCVNLELPEERPRAHLRLSLCSMASKAFSISLR
jgi:hypothetical protein